MKSHPQSVVLGVVAAEPRRRPGGGVRRSAQPATRPLPVPRCRGRATSPRRRQRLARRHLRHAVVLRRPVLTSYSYIQRGQIRRDELSVVKVEDAGCRQNSQQDVDDSYVQPQTVVVGLERGRVDHRVVLVDLRLPLSAGDRHLTPSQTASVL